ncbi:MAG: hypothetical protein Q7S47_01005 [bacterium]|nr:hypothetical protein [bacterium]
MGFNESKIIERKSVPVDKNESFVNNELEPVGQGEQETGEKTYAYVLSKTDLDIKEVEYLLDGIELGKITGADVGLAAFKCQNAISKEGASSESDSLMERVPQEAVKEYFIQCVRDKIIVLAHSVRSNSLNDVGEIWSVAGDIDDILRKGIVVDKADELRKELKDSLRSSLDEAFEKVVEKPSLDATKKLRSTASAIIKLSELSGDTRGWDKRSELEELDNKMRGWR